MSERVWINRRQPQTLYIAQLLLYFRGGLALLLTLLGGRGAGSYFLLISLAEIVAANGIANERRWGYRLGVVAASLPIVLLFAFVLRDGTGLLWRNIVGLMLDIALVALLLHPESRSYQRYWLPRR